VNRQCNSTLPKDEWGRCSTVVLKAAVISPRPVDGLEKCGVARRWQRVRTTSRGGWNRYDRYKSLICYVAVQDAKFRVTEKDSSSRYSNKYLTFKLGPGLSVRACELGPHWLG
jgi:hypothetical protein